MSNYVPPTTPIGGPQAFPPQQPFPPPPQKKSNVLMWLVVGCGTFVIIGIIAVFLGGYFVWNKAKQAGLDPELMQKQPALAVAKLAAALDKDIEVVTVDEDKGLITFKKKSTGETITVNVDQAQNGKIVFKQEGKGDVTVEAKGEGEKGSLEVKTSEGTATFGSLSVDKLPDWLPAYPGVQLEGTYSAHGKDGESGGFSFVTQDAPNKVIDFYDEGLKRAGLTVSTNILQQNGKVTGGMATAESSNKKHTAMVTTTADAQGTRVSVIFELKR
ncbi:MAG TPA: hypothetical protein VLM38_23805 [Blastocatellia bacterium]|nr:hypothetical protein [Blastocatellia bacterium]